MTATEPRRLSERVFELLREGRIVIYRANLNYPWVRWDLYDDGGTHVTVHSTHAEAISGAAS